MNDPGKNASANDEAIEAMAASWLVQQDEGFTADQAAEFARWCDADPRHAAAIAMLEETRDLLAKMPRLRETRPDFAAEAAALSSRALSTAETVPVRQKSSPRILSFPPLRRAAMAIAACVVLGLVAWRLWPTGDATTFANTYNTDAGGYLRVVLPDQSVLELNAQTEARVRFSEATRHVALARGEAHFTVAKNPARPFFVEAANVAVRAVGTAFNVRLDRSSVEVLVTEGRVHVSKGGETTKLPAKFVESPDTPIFVAGQRVIVPTDPNPAAAPRVATVNAAAIREALAWQSPRLVFVDTPLSDVVRQFNEHNRVQLEIGDADLGKRPVGGTFRADHVEVFVHLLEGSHDIAVERPGPNRIILRKVQ